LLNRLRGGGSSDMGVSEGRTTMGVDGESWIAVSFSFPLVDIGAVVIRMTICLIFFRLDFWVSCGLTSFVLLPNPVGVP
jgi:hypothetical protein